MKNRKSRYLFLFILSIYGLISQLQAQTSPLTEQFRQNGYENIRMTSHSDTLYLAFENIAWRNEADGLLEAMNILVRSDIQTAVVLILLRNKTEQVAIFIPASTMQEAVRNQSFTTGMISRFDFTTHARSYYKQVTKSKEYASSAGRTDVIIYPHFRIQNVSLDKIWEMQIGIDPAVQVQLWKGATFTGQVQIPLYNDMADREGKFLRTGVIALTQDLRLPKGWNLHFGAGLFTDRRQGLQSEFSYETPGGSLRAAMTLGLTGAIYWDNGRCTIYNWSRVNALASVSYFTNWQSLELKAEGGRYVYGDYGIRFDLIRRFKNVGIGLFASYQDNDGSCGFNFSVPIGLKHYRRKGYVRFMPANYYHFEFNEKVGSRTTNAKFGRQFNDHPVTGTIEYCFNPHYLKNALEIALKAKNAN